MGRRLKLTFVKERVSAFADLLDDDASMTCQAVWKALPIRTKAIHDIWSGPQLLMNLNPMIKLPAENLLTYIPAAGDIFYYYRPRHYFRGAPYGLAEATEIGITYDRDSRPQGPRGPKAVNLFATLSEGKVAFTKVCRNMIYEGSKDMKMERA